MMCLSCPPALRDIFPISMARYSLFVLKVPLNTNKPTKSNQSTVYIIKLFHHVVDPSISAESTVVVKWVPSDVPSNERCVPCWPWQMVDFSGRKRMTRPRPCRWTASLVYDCTRCVFQRLCVRPCVRSTDYRRYRIPMVTQLDYLNAWWVMHMHQRQCLCTEVSLGVRDR